MPDDDNEFPRHYPSPALRRRAGQEIAPGVWSDPLSEARHDYGGERAGFEAAIAQSKSIYDTVIGRDQENTAQSLDTIWDAALEIAAHIVETDTLASKPQLLAKIRAMKKVR